MQGLRDRSWFVLCVYERGTKRRGPRPEEQKKLGHFIVKCWLGRFFHVDIFNPESSSFIRCLQHHIVASLALMVPVKKLICILLTSVKDWFVFFGQRSVGRMFCSQTENINWWELSTFFYFFLVRSGPKKRRSLSFFVDLGWERRTREDSDRGNLSLNEGRKDSGRDMIF